MVRKSYARIVSVVVVLVAVASLSSCAAAGMYGEELSRALYGVSATMTTYNEAGQRLDTVHGTSFRVSRDDKFDTTDGDGVSKNDSSVLLIILGDNHISHVGSTLLLVQDGIVDVGGDTSTKVSFDNAEPGIPWLNDMYHRFSNTW